MARMTRVTVPGFPHHVVQRGNRRCRVFLDESDQTIFLRLLKEKSEVLSLQHFSYSLMPNHFHLISTPETEVSLSWTMRDVLSSYATYFNLKYGLSGRLWQGRFYSSVLDEDHFWTALRYVECNPVRAGMVMRAEDYRWSSAPAHCKLTEDPLLTQLPKHPSLIPDWTVWLAENGKRKELDFIRQKTRTGRPCGSDRFVTQLEQLLDRPLKLEKGGRPRKKTR